MSKTYYECHVTLVGDREQLRKSVESTRWLFSCIDGDPVLGEGVKCYATKHFSYRFSTKEVVKQVQKVASELRALGCNVIREKVELVIWDTKKRSNNR